MDNELTYEVIVEALKEIGAGTMLSAVGEAVKHYMKDITEIYVQPGHFSTEGNLFALNLILNS